MRVEEVEGVRAMLESGAVAKDRLWSRPLAQVTETEIQMFYARCGALGKREPPRVSWRPVGLSQAATAVA